MRTYVTFGVVVLAASSQAIVCTTSTTSPGAADATWSYVGQMNGASAVAIGRRTVLTARHVGAGTFSLNGSNYDVLNSVVMPDIENPYTHGNSQVDLILVNLKSDLPGWYDVADSKAIGETVTMVGYGRSGVVNAAGNGYNVSVSSGTRRAGNNTLDDAGFLQGLGPAMVSVLKNAGDAVVADKDSGGGWFSGGKLVGLTSFIFNGTDVGAGGAYPNYGFGSANTAGYTNATYGINLAPGEAYFGSGAIDLTDSRIRSFIHTNAVPEPSTYAAVALGLFALVRRKKR